MIKRLEPRSTRRFAAQTAIPYTPRIIRCFWFDLRQLWCGQKKDELIELEIFFYNPLLGETIPRSRGTKYGDGGSLKVLRISPASLPPFTQMPKPWWESGGSLVMVIVLTVSSCRLSGCEIGDVGGFPDCCCCCCDCCDCCCCCCEEAPEAVGVLRTVVTLAGLDAGDLRSPWRRSEALLPWNSLERKIRNLVLFLIAFLQALARYRATPIMNFTITNYNRDSEIENHWKIRTNEIKICNAKNI